jgi:hypothetical protein
MDAKGSDRFGFRLGSKRAVAARLYEAGATQAEMIAATGTTQYNMLKEAKRRGHHVMVQGGRYWLIHASDVRSPHPPLRVSAAPEIAAQYQPAIWRSQRASGTLAGERVAACPAVLSIVGCHANESQKTIVQRKGRDVAMAGITLWVYQSWKARVRAVQEFARLHPGTPVYFLEGGAVPTGTTEHAQEMSEDGLSWLMLPKGIGAVTGKLTGGACLVLDQLSPVTTQTIDLWEYVEYPSLRPVKFGRGASTACVVPSPHGPSSGMKSRFRRVVAIGRLAAPKCSATPLACNQRCSGSSRD